MACSAYEAWSSSEDDKHNQIWLQVNWRDKHISLFPFDDKESSYFDKISDFKYHYANKFLWTLTVHQIVTRVHGDSYGSDDNFGLFNKKSVLQTKYRPLFL